MNCKVYYIRHYNLQYFQEEVKMVKTCSINGCNNRSTLGCGISFHRFPLKNPTKLKEWLKAIGREDWIPTKHHIICSEHFQPSDFYISSSLRKVRPGAVPSLNLGLYTNNIPGYQDSITYAYMISKRFLDDQLTDSQLSNVSVKNSDSTHYNHLDLQNEVERLRKLNEEYCKRIEYLEQKLEENHFASSSITVKEEPLSNLDIDLFLNNPTQDFNQTFNRANRKRRKSI